MRAIASSFLPLLLLPISLLAQPPKASELNKSYLPSTRLTASDAQRDDYFGWSVGADGAYLVTGLPYDNTGVTLTPGSAYVFRRDGSSWSQVIKLVPPDGVDFDTFGESIAIDSGLIVVGAPERDGGRGSIYLFRESAGSWNFETRLEASDRQASARFGASVAVRGDDILVGSPGAQGSRGAAYVFRRSGGSWTQQQRLAAADAAANDLFGRSVAIDGDTALIGAPLRDESFSNQGAAYLFTRSGSSWTQQVKWLHPNAAASDQLGESVALRGNFAALGAPFADRGGFGDAGLVETYVRSGASWTRSAGLIAPTPSANAQFGFAVAVRGPRLLVGLASENVGGEILRGSLQSFLYEDGSWTAGQNLIGNPGGAEDQVGYSVALSDDFAVGGAPGASIGSLNYTGAVHAFIQLQTGTQISPVAGQPIRIGSSYPVQVAVSAHEGTATGSVLIRDDVGGSCTATLNTGSGSCSLTATAVGPRTLQARYGGAPGYAESFASASVQVKPDLRISPDTLPAGQIGAPYAALFDTAGTGASLPLSYALVAGSLPPGLGLGGNGSLTGTPTAFGSFAFSVRVTDSSAPSLGGPFSETRAYSLQIAPPFTTTLALGVENTVGDRGSSQVYTATLDVVEADGDAPIGSFVVSAQLGGQTLSCSAPVTAEGAQSCSLLFPAGAALGNWLVTARFISDNPGGR